MEGIRRVLLADTGEEFRDGFAAAVENEAGSLSQITEGINQIAAVVHTNSATSEESAAASEELSSQARLLQELIQGFELPQNQ